MFLIEMYVHVHHVTQPNATAKYPSTENINGHVLHNGILEYKKLNEPQFKTAMWLNVRNRSCAK